jgi:hypothetical protein
MRLYYYAAGVSLSAAERNGLDLMLNEALLLDAELDPDRCLLGLSFYVEMVPERGERASDDLYLLLLLHGLTRLAVSFREGASWLDEDARVEPLALDALSAALGRIRYPDAVYGRRFFDLSERSEFTPWRELVSVEYNAVTSGGTCVVEQRDLARASGLHTLTVWSDELQIGRDCQQRLFFDLHAVFEHISIRDGLGRAVELDDAIAASRRYWDAVEQRGSGGPSPYPVARRRIPLPD